jgi:multidrug efflux pump subunit AcrA (membrane-fusion protein)
MAPTNDYLSSILSWMRRNFWGLATIGVITIVCIIIVQVFKKPGQMSVIESQAMDMTAMVPPVGAVPVGIARVHEQAIEGSVTYTGTVQAFVDEDIYPRITGRITAMPVYPGDQVKKGQLLVQLDPLESEYKAKRDEAFYAEDAAKHNAGIAKTEFAQKKYELQAAEKAEEAAKKAIEEANANLKYWIPEVEREKVLYEKAVISLDEYQRELSLCEAARARVQQSEAKLQEATNTKLAAQAALDEMIHHIGHQYALSKQAKATLANASIYQNYTTISAQDDAVVTKRVISPNVVVNPGMLLLKLAHVKQVRIQAEVASDDVEKIRLGNTVYIKSSQGSKDELTAQVTSIFPAADPTSRTFTVEALIDNLVDGKSIGSQKQNQIEAVTQYRYLPGQYVVMRIETGKHEGLVIPTSAVVWREGKAQVWKAVSSGESDTGKAYQCPMHPEVISDKPGKCPKCGMSLEPVKQEKTADTKPEYTCTMHPEVISDKPGKCPKCGMDLVPKKVGGRQVAYLADITIGLSNPDKTEVLTGLKEGDEVIFAGYANLQPGMPVVATEWGSQGPKELPLASEVAGNRLDASNNWKQEEMRDHLMVETSLSPAKSSANSIIVKLSKHGGGAVVGSRVNIKTSMPGMNMTGPTLSGITGANGEAVMKSNLSSGLWQLQISIGVPGQAAVESTLDVEVP